MNRVIEEALKYLDTNGIDVTNKYSEEVVTDNIRTASEIDYVSILSNRDINVSDQSIEQMIYDSLEDKSKAVDMVRMIKSNINKKLQSFLAYGRFQDKHNDKNIFEVDDMFDQDELDMGINVEMEHTNDPEIAKRIALDHLTESSEFKFSGYYTWLKFMEDCMKKGLAPEDLIEKSKRV